MLLLYLIELPELLRFSASTNHCLVARSLTCFFVQTVSRALSLSQFHSSGQFFVVLCLLDVHISFQLSTFLLLSFVFVDVLQE